VLIRVDPRRKRNRVFSVISAVKCYLQPLSFFITSRMSIRPMHASTHRPHPVQPETPITTGQK